VFIVLSVYFLIDLVRKFLDTSSYSNFIYQTQSKQRRRKQKWIDDVTKDLKKLNIIGWKEKAKNRVVWRQLVEEAKAHIGL
jgi:hypothetical protein